MMDDYTGEDLPEFDDIEHKADNYQRYAEEAEQLRQEDLAYRKFESHELYNSDGVKISISMEYKNFVIVTPLYYIYWYFNGHIEIFDKSFRSKSLISLIKTPIDLSFFSVCTLNKVIVSANADVIHEKVERLLNLKAFL